MSQILINDYLKQLDVIKKVSGSSRETIVREAFKDLLKAWGKQQGLIFLKKVPEKIETSSRLKEAELFCRHVAIFRSSDRALSQLGKNSSATFMQRRH